MELITMPRGFRMIIRFLEFWRRTKPRGTMTSVRRRQSLTSRVSTRYKRPERDCEIARKRPNPHVMVRFQNATPQDLFTSAVCIEEIYFGIRAGPDCELVRQRMESRVLHRVTVLDFNEA